MCKCDFCQRSRLVNGKLVCPYTNCVLCSWEIDKILEALGGKTKSKKSFF